MLPIAIASSGAVSVTPIQNRRVMSRSSAFSSCATLTVRGSSTIPQIGQLPGSVRTISGCIGQVYSDLCRRESRRLRLQSHPTFRTRPGPNLPHLGAHRADIHPRILPRIPPTRRPGSGVSRSRSILRRRGFRSHRHSNRHQPRALRLRAPRQHRTRISRKLRQASSRAKKVVPPRMTGLGASSSLLDRHPAHRINRGAHADIPFFRFAHRVSTATVSEVLIHTPSRPWRNHVLIRYSEDGLRTSALNNELNIENEVEKRSREKRPRKKIKKQKASRWIDVNVR